MNDKVLDDISERFTRRGLKITDNNRRQALVPERGGYFENPNGTAPGLFFDARDGVVIALPGPPRELVPMFENDVIPLLKQRALIQANVPSTLFRLVGIPESQADHRLKPILKNYSGLELSLLCTPNLVDVTVFGENAADLERVSGEIEAEFGDSIYSRSREAFGAVLGDLLRGNGLSLAVAESCTGGLIGGALTEQPGSSDYFQGGIISYSNDVKRKMLGVAREVLETHGAVSRQTARLMAEGVRRLLEADIGLSVTGIAGPGGGTAEKPVGLVYIACADAARSEVKEHHFMGDRDSVRTWTVRKGLEMAREFLLQGLQPT